MSELSQAQYAELRKICVAIAVKKLHMFKNHPWVTTDDLIQVAMVGPSVGSLGGALRAHERYDPSKRPQGVKASYSAWIGLAASSAILDYLGQETAAKRTPVEHVYPRFAFACPTHEIELPCVPAPLNRYMGALAYREEHGLSWWGLWLRLRLDLPLCQMLGFKRAPAMSSLHLGKKRLREWASK